MANTGTKNRLLALLIALAMCAALLPLAALADTETLDDGTAVQTVTTDEGTTVDTEASAAVPTLVNTTDNGDGTQTIMITIAASEAQEAIDDEYTFELPIDAVTPASSEEEADTIIVILPTDVAERMTVFLAVNGIDEFVEVQAVSDDEIGYEIPYSGSGIEITIEYSASFIIVTTAPAANELSYNGTAQALVTAGTTPAEGTMYYSLDGTEWSAEIPTAIDEGTYTVYYKLVDDSDGYDRTETASVTVTIAEAAAPSVPTYTPPTANTLTYNGEAQALISAGTAEGGTMYYSLDGDEWTADIPTGTDAGTYTVYYKVLGDEGYSDIDAASITVTIAARRTGSGGGGNPDPVTVTNTVTNGDGSTTTTVTGTDGTVTETTAYIDGITVTSMTNTDGDTAYSVTLSEDVVTSATESGSIIVLPIDSVKVADSIDSLSNISLAADNTYLTIKGADTVTVEYSFSEEITLAVPVDNATETTVPVFFRGDGSSFKGSLATIDGGTFSVRATDTDSNSYYIGNFPTAEEYIVLMLNGSATLVLADNAKEYSDVTKDDWYSDAVDFVSAREIMVGTGDGVFDPDSSMTRGMVVQTVYNLDTGTESGNSLSNYATDDPFYREAVDWAADVGIVAGYDDGSFNGDNDITREQLATMLYRYAEYIDCDTSPLSNLSQFTDESSVSTYAQEALQWAVGAGIIEGMDDGTLNSNGTATRAQVAAVLARFIKFTVGAA
ncbi:MAG: S-layer homology domain-containing protein [Oscillospiraceae bacterium]|nr:S-layer homology domain-containing protein [Oscillospiraceae bacterium]